MEKRFVKHLYEFFKRLIEVHGLQLKAELNEGQTYMIEYSSGNFVVKIEKYFREFYVTLYKINKPDDEVNLFNLLEFLKQGEADVPQSEYFRHEKDIDECYKKQLNHLSTVVYQNYNLINEFFSQDHYEANMHEFEKFWKNKHPEFYERNA